ncbi:F-box protein [Candidatus Protochlamydia phocaeensis]|uniref:F-box protein n=1 Tax=Candidatus Protochlamydia phocaeensis TaxID=1414722 RepID=UPI000837E909|nr:F-box protein [Candidatus Protochlamydia phocaeensis]
MFLITSSPSDFFPSVAGISSIPGEEDFAVERSGFVDIPELALMIFSYLDQHSLYRASLVCKKWKALSESDYLWKAIAQRLDLLPELKADSSASIKLQVEAIQKAEKGMIVVRTQAQFYDKLHEIYQKTDGSKLTGIHYLSAANKCIHVYINISTINTLQERGLISYNSLKNKNIEPKKLFSSSDHQFTIKGRGEGDFFKIKQKIAQDSIDQNDWRVSVAHFHTDEVLKPTYILDILSNPKGSSKQKK